ncbi:alpha-2-macroglobulin [Telmatocola sphagniphila]|uniref:Alpha-2-macroglobulin n=1 Tax=Telmatocola sphagniphila TaxID=1123043 RepID=A0A8E6ES98_9BACT|nr:alpha-2-macroglobulin family protein [Telmatocola sphagniphila]QVL30394.1 alpha-2-macroglobulin [Telmatocola sphagniphila]
MTTRDQAYYEALMLDHQYGLLEPEQVTELEAYLQGPDGDRLIKLAEAWKAKLTKAASKEFPNVEFRAPTEMQLATAQPGVPTRKSHRILRFLIAASLLAAAGVVGVPYYQQTAERNRQAAEVASLKNSFALAAQKRQEYADRFRNERTKLEAEILLAQKSYEATTQAAEEKGKKFVEELSSRKVVIKLSGPERPMPGAPNEWKVTTLDRANQPLIPAMISLVIRNQAEKEIYSVSLQNPDTTSTLRLPVSAWKNVKPSDELTLEITAKMKDDVGAKLVEKLKLARPVFITHLATDKPLYQPGETLRFRSLTLERSTLIPPPEDQMVRFKVVKPDGSEQLLAAGNGRVINEQGMPIALANSPPIRGIGVGEWIIPEGAPGGEYTLVVMNDYKELEKRKFIVNRYVPDKFFKKLEFDGKSYGPGDIVQVRSEASRTEGGALKNQTIFVSAIVDGVNVPVNAPKTTDDKGVVNLKFTLPKEIKSGQGTLSITYMDGTGPEVISRPIPIIGRQLNVDFYPEGGDLIAELDNRVYFQVRTPYGKPADLKGYITDGKNKIADVQTLTDTSEAGVSRGQGSFTFKPQANVKYYLKVERPLNIEEPKDGFVLPTVKPDGVVLTALDEVTSGDAPIRVQIQTPREKRRLVVGAYGRGKLLDHQLLNIEPNKPTKIELGGGVNLGGVIRVTVFEDLTAANGESNLIPLAERLVFRKTPNNLILNVKPDKNRYNPGSRVGLEISSKNEKDSPLPAVLMVGVVNQSVITMADNKTDRLMPTHFLLAGEVKKPEDLEHADFLLSDHPKAAKALDNLLGTQGWRRFAEQNPTAFVASKSNVAEKQEAERLLVSTGQVTKPASDLLFLERQKFLAEYQPKLEDYQAKLNKSRNDLNAFLAQMRSQKEYQQLSSSETQAESSYLAAERELRAAPASVDLEEPLKVAEIILFLTGLLVVTITLVRRIRKHQPLGSYAWVGLILSGIPLVAFLLVNRSEVTKKPLDFSRDATTMPAPAAIGAARIFKDDLDQMLREEAELRPGAAMNPMEKMEFGGGGFGGAPGAQGGGFGGFGGGPVAKAEMRMAPMIARGNKGVGAPEALKGGDNAKKLDMARPMMPRNAMMKQAQKPAGDLDKNRDMAKDREQFDGKRKVMAAGAAPMAGGFAGPGMGGGGFFPDIGGGAGGPGGGGFRSPNGLAAPANFLAAWEEVNGQIVAMQKVMPGALVVREYAHTKTPDATNPELRNDFTETVYWNPVIVLPDTGKITIHFDLADDVTRYQVMVAGHTLDGRVAANVSTIEARKPFSVDPKLPVEISSADQVDVPVRIVNDSDTQREVKFSVNPQGLELLPSDLRREGDRWVDSIALDANGKNRKVYSFKPAVTSGSLSLQLDATSLDAPSDHILRHMTVVPDGFPVSGQVSDLLDKKATPTIKVPGDILPGTMKVQVKLFPTTLADLQAGLDGLLREPCGCFEQTSTSNYPNTLILDYLSTSDQAKPEVSKRAKDLLERGYQKLTSFECMKVTNDGRQGYEWFGGTAPPHEALTAYGLLQFVDMSHVQQVDPLMIKRTRDYLLSQRDGNGSFKRNQRALDTFGRAPQHVTDAYIVWALTESDLENKEKIDLSKEFEALEKKAQSENDPYFLSLLANALFNRGKTEAGLTWMKKATEKQLKPDGRFTGAVTSITSSGGRDLEIETTSLAVLALLKANRPELFTENIQLAIRWLGRQRGGYGGFGSTQSTILALKALIAYTKDQKKMPEGGTLTLFVNDKKVAEKVFSAADREVITLDVMDPEKLFTKGENKNIRLELDTKQGLPYTLAWECRTARPLSSDECALELKTSLDKAVAKEGDTLQMSMKLKNKLDKGHGMSVAILGLPAGSKVPTDLKQLTRLREENKISYFEIRGRELVLYWREMAPKAELELKIDLVCETPGVYRGPASRAYLYYNADNKAWIDPLAITIKPQE